MHEGHPSPEQPDDRLFSEESFYLREFSGRTLALAIPDESSATNPELHRIVRRLVDNGTRCVLVLARAVSPDSAWPGAVSLSIDSPRLPGEVWRAAREKSVVVIRAVDDLPTATLQVATRLGLFKVVVLNDVGGIQDSEGERRSFVHGSDVADLRDQIQADDPLAHVLADVEALIVAGVPNVNICTVAGLNDELFTYAGSGTLFTRDRYVHVRRFGIEDFDAADHLIARGAREGYLAPRTDEQIDFLLADGFGAFVGGAHLAGIGALRVPPGSEAGEVASLYTITRFAGGGIGRNLVSFAIRRAKELSLAFVYACTTFERVGVFFERQGFRPVDPSEIPDEKWQGYDEARRMRLRCYRCDL